MSASTTNSIEAAEEVTVANVARALAHPARIRIVRFLLSRKNCIGGDIVEEIGLAQSTVSEHLRILKAAGVVSGEIERPRICYSLNPAGLAPLAELLREVLETGDEARTDHAQCEPGS
ncbi:MAG: metalloregulator ArsR/SmtB family transcription factor [Wenzhouxiangellaceae bacterium]|nr:metalloregulator ArsR/SmtB family transcription factor [Wenzhouxiangellaceae bacterium]